MIFYFTNRDTRFVMSSCSVLLMLELLMFIFLSTAINYWFLCFVLFSFHFSLIPGSSICLLKKIYFILKVQLTTDLEVSKTCFKP